MYEHHFFILIYMKLVWEPIEVDEKPSIDFSLLLEGPVFLWQNRQFGNTMPHEF